MGVTSAWQLLQLAIEKAWLAPDGQVFFVFFFLAQTSIENDPFTL